MDVLGLIEIPTYVVYSFLAAILLLIRFRWKYSYWRKQGVPAPTPWPFVDTLTVLIGKKPLHQILVERYKKYGKTYGVYEANRNSLVTANPEDMKSVLVKDFHVFTNRKGGQMKDPVLKNFLTNLRDEDWHLVRNAVSPTFSGLKLKKMTERLIACSDNLAKYLHKMAKNEKEFDAKRIFGAYTLDVIASTAFKTNINSLEDPDNAFVKNAKEVLEFKLTWRTFLRLVAPKLSAMLDIPSFDKAAITFFADVVKKIIRMRGNDTQPASDFLSLLLKGKADGNQESINDTTQTKPTKELLTDQMIVSQCILFFLAGYDTTATTLTMTAYHLARSQECQDKLLEELDAAVEKHGGLTYDSIGDMPYLNACVKETLRLYPPLISTDRQASENYQLGDIFLEKGTVVSFPVFAIHHDPENWPDPEKYDPERFMCNASEIDPYKYLPFGYGKRNCVAMRFALYEVKMALAVALTKVKFHSTPRTKYPPNLGVLGLLQPKDIFIAASCRT